MMLWQDYLSLLSWQGCKLVLQDFINLYKQKNISNPDNFVDFIFSLELKEYLLHNKHWWKKAEIDYKYCQSKNYQLLYPGKKHYPKKFFHIFENVPIMHILGSLDSQENCFPVSFVGSRTADEQVLNWMDFYIPYLLLEKKISIVSGGARGVDQKAHSIAIRSKIPTICFLPSGLDQIYPSSLHKFKQGILDNGGAFISCFPPWASMYKSYFHIRNSIMSAYSSLVMILQAHIRSGTMLTAKKALEYHVPIGVLPGPVLSAAWTGNLQLIYDGAYLIRDNVDLSLLLESLSMKDVDKELESSSLNKALHSQNDKLLLQ